MRYRKLFLGHISEIANPRVTKPLFLALLSSCAAAGDTIIIGDKK